MKAIQTNAGKIEIKEILSAIAQEKVFDIEQFLNQIKNILDQKKSPVFIQKEKALLDKIKKSEPSKEWWQKYNQLADKSDDKTLNEIERKDFKAFIKTLREWELERIKLMLELAQLWNTSLDEVQQYLENTPQENIYA